MSEDPTSCVIWSGEHRAYWRANASGYTTILEAAGIYNRDDALAVTGGCGPEKKIEIRPVTFKTITVPVEIAPSPDLSPPM